MRRWPRFAAPVGWALFAVVAALLKWGHLVIPDEGVTLTEAWQISQGLVPYRDFFDFFTPGSLYVVAAVFRIFGPSYAAAKIVSLLLFLSSAYAVYRISGYVGMRRYRWTWPWLWLLCSNHYVLINHNIFSLVLAFWATERTLAAYLAPPRPNDWRKRWLGYAVAGGLGGATVWMHQARGAAVVAAGLLFFALVQRRAFVAYVVGLGLSLLPFLAWPLGTLWFSFVEFPFRYYYPANQISVTYTMFLLLLAGFGLAGWGLVRFRASSPARWLWWGSGVLLLLSNFSRPDAAHLLPVAFPLLAMVAMLADAATQPAARWLKVVLATAAAAFGLASLTIMTTRINAVGLVNFLQLRDGELERLVAVVQAETAPGEPIFAAPYLPNLYFEARRRNPTQLNMAIFSHHPDAFLRQAISDMTDDPPKLVLLNYFVLPADFDQFLIGYPITDFVRQHYVYAMTINGVQIYRRR